MSEVDRLENSSARRDGGDIDANSFADGGMHLRLVQSHLQSF